MPSLTIGKLLHNEGNRPGRARIKVWEILLTKSHLDDILTLSMSQLQLNIKRL